MAENTQLPADLVSLWAEQPDGMERALRWLREAVAHTYMERQMKITSPDDAAELFLYEMSALEEEHLRVLLLDTRQQIIKVHEVAGGSTDSVQVRMAEIFREAVRVNAVALIMVHNHPSGNPQPSPDDLDFTRAAVRAGKVLGIHVQDHLVVGGGRYVSIRRDHPKAEIDWHRGKFHVID